MIWAIMVFYQYVMLIVDFAYLCLRCTLLFFLSLYHFFDPPKMKSVVGETILITGAGHGIGRELSLQFARLGAKVVCLDINEEGNKSTVAQIKKEGGSGWAFWCDVSKQDEVKAVSDKIRRVIGDVSILVNNAAIMPSKPFTRYTPREIEKLFQTNVYSHFWTMMEWLPTFQEQGRGHIVAISSICGVMGTANLSPYCSTKYAVTGLMEALNEELRYGNQHPNIKITTVHPFVVDTGLALKPRIRFPSFSRILGVDEAAQLIIQSMRRQEEIVYLPYKQYYVQKIYMALPRKIQLSILDFLDTGVDSHEEIDWESQANGKSLINGRSQNQISY